MEGDDRVKLGVKYELAGASQERTMETSIKEEPESDYSFMEPELIIDSEEPLQDELPPRLRTSKRRCSLCPRKRDKKTSLSCFKCNNVCCREHMLNICKNCYKDD